MMRFIQLLIPVFFLFSILDLQAGETLKVGIYHNPPKVFLDDSGKASGFFIDVIEEIAHKENLQLEYVYDVWPVQLVNISDGTIDILVDVAYNDNRAGLFSFNRVPVIESWLQVFARPQHGLQQVSDLNGKIISVLSGSIQQYHLEEYLLSELGLEFEIALFDDYPSAMKAVERGHAHAMIADRFFYFSPLRSHDVVPTPLIFNPGALYFAFSPYVNPQLARDFDVILSDIKNNPASVYYQSLTRWFEIPSAPVIRYYNLWILLVSVAGIVALSFFLYRLRKKLVVNAKELSFRNAILESANKMLEELLEEKKVAEKKLRESEEVFRTLFHQSGDAFGLLRDKIFVDCNPAMIKLLGVADKYAIIGKTPWALSPPEQPDGKSSEEKAKEMIATVLEEGNHRFEWLHQKPDGMIFFVEVVLTSILFKGKTLLHVSWRDISERKEMEELLRSSEEKYRLMVENQNDLVVKVDNDGKFMFVSPSYCKMFGKKREELLDKTFLPLVHPDDREPTRKAMEQLYKPPYHCRLQQRALTAEGWKWLEWTDTSVLNENKEVIAIIGVGRDITAQKEAELALHQSEKRWMMALEGTGEGVWDWNLQTNEVFYSSHWKYMLGYDDKDDINSYEHWEQLVHPEDLEGAVLSLQNHMQGKTKAYRHEFRMKAKNGDYKWVLDRGKIVEFDERGKPLRMIGTHTDITSMKTAQLELEKQNEFISTILDNLPIGVAVNAFDSGRATYMNNCFSEIYGWDETVLVDIKSFFQNVYPDKKYREKIKKQVQKDIESGDRERMRWSEIEITTQQGEKRFVDAVNIPLPQQNIMVSTVVNVTERMHSRRKLQEWHNLLQYIIFHDPNAIAVHDENLHYLFVSKRYLEDYGIKEKDVIGKHPYEVFPDIPDRWKEVHQRCLNGETLQAEEDIFHRGDGTTEYTRWACMPWYRDDNSIGGIVLYTEVITPRKKVELDLQEQRDILSLLLNIAKTVGESLTFEDAVRFTLEQVCRTTGWEMAEFWLPHMHDQMIHHQSVAFYKDEILAEFGKHSKDYKFKPGEGLPGKAWASKKPVWMFDLIHNPEFVRKHLVKEIQLQTGVAIPVMARNEVVCIMVFFSREKKKDDASIIETITATALQLGELFLRKQAEQEVRLMNAELEERVERRTHQLEVVNKELEAFSYSVSHDLRAPLRAIAGFTQIIASDYEQSLDMEAKRLFSIIRHNTELMDQLITHLLEFSRSGKSEIKKVMVNMKELALSVYQEVSNGKKLENVEVIIKDLPHAWADPTLIKQVWHNLLSNAVKYTAPRENPIIEIGAYQEDSEFVFYVKDNGVGFNPRYASKIFQVFQRLHKSSEFEGTGVGLALAQRIVSRHEGRIWAEGEPGQGATFWFSLPKKGEN